MSERTGVRQALLEDWLGTGWMLDSLECESSVTITLPNDGAEAELAAVCAFLRDQGYAVWRENSVWPADGYGPVGERYVTVCAERAGSDGGDE